MAVDDGGLEALRKAAEEVVPGEKGNTYIKVRDVYVEAKLDLVLAAIQAIYDILFSTTLLFLVDDEGNQLVDDDGNNLMG